MKVFKTNGGKGILLNDSELVALGFVAINLLGQTGIPFLDEYSQRTTPTLLSGYQIDVLKNSLDLGLVQSNHLVGDGLK